MSWIKCYSNKIESVWENVHTIIDLPTSSSRYRSDRHFSEFLTCTMAAKINWHTRRTKKLRHCHPEHMLRCKGKAILRDPELWHWPLTLVDPWIGGLLPLGPSESANCWQSCGEVRQAADCRVSVAISIAIRQAILSALRDTYLFRVTLQLIACFAALRDVV